MGVTKYDWASTLQVEANKFWFYGTALSILLSLYQILCPPSEKSSSPAKPGDAKSGQDEVAASSKVNPMILSQLTIDCFDVLAPGAALGWIPVPMLIVGITYVLSSAIAAQPIWQRVQHARRAKAS